MTALVIDKKRDFEERGTHALIVGISHYENLPTDNAPPDPARWGMRRLSSPALSAFRVFQTLTRSDLRLAAPLKTCRLLLSPSLLELKKEPLLKKMTIPAATRDEFQNAVVAWRDDAKHNRKDVTFFYFAGHGAQRGADESILVFDDVFEPGWPPQNKCALFSSIKNGMAPSDEYANIAQEQFYFIDSCRVVPDALKAVSNSNIPDVFSGLSNVDHRAAPAFFATVDGAIAVGRKGRPSIFCEALLHGLHHAADHPEEDDNGEYWPVTALSLKHGLDRYIASHNYKQDVLLGSCVGDPTLLSLAHAPEVEIRLQFVPENPGICALSLHDSEEHERHRESPWHTPQITVPVGAYRLHLTGENLTKGYRSRMVWLDQRWMRPWRHDLASLLGARSSLGTA